MLQNTGSQTTTYDFSVTGLPAGVTASFNQPSITLASGASVAGGSNGITLSLSEPGATTLVPADFSVVATAEGAAEITDAVSGALALRPELLLVGNIQVTPPYTLAGGQVTSPRESSR